MGNLLSVIVPVYKVEEYLNDCLTSIVNQSYHNLEVILVDDGSPDKCPQMCDEWAKKDSRIKVIHKLNGGLSSARNAGLDIATGDYIAFVDSDDWISNDMYAKMIAEIEDNDVDVVAAKILVCKPSSCYIFHEESGSYIVKRNTVFNQKEYLTLALSNQLETAVWNKIFKRKLFEGLRFKVGRLNEDYLMMYQIGTRLNRLLYLTDVFYNYRIREGSICTSGSTKHEMDKNIKEISIDIDKRPQLRYLKSSLDLFEFNYYILCCILAIKSNNKEDFNYYSDKLRGKKMPKHIILKNQIFYLLIVYCPFVLFLLYNKKNKL